MIRKVLISSIILVFFVSTTGLPVTIHFCSMSKSEMTHCKMHSKCMHCDGSEHSSKAEVKLKKEDCCKTEYKYEAIADKFLQINSQKDFQNQNLITAILLDITITINPQEVSHNIFTGPSPPQLYNNHIYLNNSIFLI